jgi:hypothetical protein
MSINLTDKFNKRPTDPGYYLIRDRRAGIFVGVIHALYGPEGKFHYEWVFGYKREIAYWDNDFSASKLTR